MKLQYFGHLMQRADSLEKTLMLGGIGGSRRKDDRGWDGWMASRTQWTWVWVNSRRWWWTGRPGVLRFMGSQIVGHDWASELNWTEGLLLQNGRKLWCHLTLIVNEETAAEKEEMAQKSGWSLRRIAISSFRAWKMVTQEPTSTCRNLQDTKQVFKVSFLKTITLSQKGHKWFEFL